MTFLEFQELGAYACALFGGWELGNLLRAAWPALVGRSDVVPQLDRKPRLVPGMLTAAEVQAGLREMGRAARASGITLPSRGDRFAPYVGAPAKPVLM